VGSFALIFRDAKHMAREVNSAVEKIARDLGKLDGDSSISWVKKLRAFNRYLEDVWS
jgi:sulfite reductase alpha subunit-like flavoprotein